MAFLGCALPDSTIAAWEERLVFDPEPLFLSEGDMSLLPAGTLVRSREEFREDFASAPLDLRDTYRTYAVDARADRVALVGASELAALPVRTWRRLAALQGRLDRGQVYDWAFAARVLGRFPAALRLLEGCSFFADGRRRVILRHDAWWALAPAARRAWLLAFAGDGQVPCLSSRMGDAVWEGIAQSVGPSVRVLAGTFAERSGPNCFATVLAGLTTDPAAARSVSSLWLQVAPFLRALAALGYTRRTLEAGADDVPAGAVLGWEDADGGLRHAALCLGDGLALNKGAQVWWAPRQVRRLDDLLADWDPWGTPVVFAGPTAQGEGAAGSDP